LIRVALKKGFSLLTSSSILRITFLTRLWMRLTSRELEIFPFVSSKSDRKRSKVLDVAKKTCLRKESAI